MRNVLAIMISVAFLISCTADVRSIKKTSLIGEVPIMKTSVDILDETTFGYGTGTITIQPGTYLPVAQDDGGVFYAAPVKVIMSSAGLRDGGICLKFSDTSKGSVWTSSSIGVLIHCEFPGDFKLESYR